MFKIINYGSEGGISQGYLCLRVEVNVMRTETAEVKIGRNEC